MICKKNQLSFKNFEYRENKQNKIFFESVMTTIFQFKIIYLISVICRIRKNVHLPFHTATAQQFYDIFKKIIQNIQKKSSKNINKLLSNLIGNKSSIYVQHSSKAILDISMLG